MKALLLISAVAASTVTATIGAQEKAPKTDSTCTTYPGGRIECRIYRGALGDSAMGGRFFYRMDSAMAKRAALGIEVRATGTRRDTLGVFVEAVTPKGPAETAGIIEGDRIASINGVDLRTSAADTEDSYTNGLAPHRLTREVQKLSPGARVDLRVFSGGRFRDVQVTAGKASEVMRLGNRMMMPGMGGMMRFEGPGDAMMFGPDMPMLRERMEPMMRMQTEPLLREKLRDLPRRMQLSAPLRFRTPGPTRVRAPRVYKVERGSDRGVVAGDIPEIVLSDDPIFVDEGELFDFDEPFVFDFDAPFEFEEEIEPVSSDAIRELAATAIRDAQVALKQLAAAQTS